MIQVEKLQKIYTNHSKRAGLFETSFTVPTGQIVGIMGANGAGKTTLLRAMAGLLPNVQGTALFDGAPPQQSYAQLSYITGEGSYFSGLSVAQYGAYLQDLHPAFDAKRYAQFLDFFALEPQAIISRLSTGQRARVELAAGFAKRVKYYLMDEPFLGKDVFTRRDFLKLMSGSLHGEESILLSTHYVEEVEHFLDRVLIFHEGFLVQDVEMDALRQSGRTLLDCMEKACGYDAARYLLFEQEA